MYAVFGLKRILLFIAALIVVQFIAVFGWNAPQDAWEVGKTAWKIASGTITGFLLLGSVPPLFRFGWRCYEKLIPSVYPDISGTWVGTVQSNYAIHRAVREAAISTNLTLDSLDPTQINSIPLDEFNAQLRITTSLLRINIVMEVEGLTDRSQSFSISASPEVAANGEAHRLAYIYRSTHHAQAPDDVASHTGAALVDLRRTSTGALEMKGHYWTLRNWRRAGNTAGILTFVRQDAES